MKKYLIFLILSVFLVSSCQDEIQKALEPKIYSEPTDKNYPKSDEDILTVLASFYANFGSSWGPIDPSDTNSKTNKMWAAYCCMNGWSQLSSATTDEFIDTWLPVKYKFAWAKNENIFLYPGLYQRVSVVAKATGFIDIFEKQISELLSQGLSATDKKVVKRKVAIAELKAMRAWTMFLLYDWFGAVDVKTNYADLAVMAYGNRPSADPKSEYTTNYLYRMISDFKAAKVDIYKSRKDSAGTGLANADHLHVDVINMLLMKHYMNYASATGESNYWDSAKVYCDEIQKGGKYALLSDYSQVFLEKQNENNSEVIWRTTFGSDPQLVGFHFQTNLPVNCVKINGIQTKGNYWSGYAMPWDFYDSYDSIDTRKAGLADRYTLLTDSTKTVNGKKIKVVYEKLISREVGRFGQLDYGALVVKWLKSDVSDQGQFGVTAFRYADVLLSAAEIELNRAGGDVSKAQSLIKQITDRAGTSSTKDRVITEKSVPTAGVLNVIGASTALAPGCDPSIIKEFLFQERGRELYWEGWRRMDMIRFKSNKAYNKYLEYAAKYNPTNAYDTHWNLFPLPMKVMIEANGKYQDNPGY